MNNTASSPPRPQQQQSRNRPPPPPPPGCMLPPPPRIEKEKEWDDTMSVASFSSVATSGGLPALSVYETGEEEFRRESLLENKLPTEFKLTFMCKKCTICQAEFKTVKEGLEHLRKSHYKKRCPKCFICLTSTGNDYKNHLANHYTRSKSHLEHIQCSYCTKVFHYEDLWNHVEAVHLVCRTESNEFQSNTDTDKDLPQPTNAGQMASPAPFAELPSLDILQTFQKEPTSTAENLPYISHDTILDLCLGNLTPYSANSTPSRVANTNSFGKPPRYQFHQDSDDDTEEHTRITVNGRKYFSEKQKTQLVDAFLEDPNPSWEYRTKYFATSFNCDPHRIMTWFSKERNKFMQGNSTSLPMWAKSAGGLPMYKGMLLPNNKLTIVPIQCGQPSPARRDSTLPDTTNCLLDDADNNECLKHVEMVTNNIPAELEPICCTEVTSEDNFKQHGGDGGEDMVQLGPEVDKSTSSGYESDDNSTVIFQRDSDCRKFDTNNSEIFRRPSPENKSVTVEDRSTCQTNRGKPGIKVKKEEKRHQIDYNGHDSDSDETCILENIKASPNRVEQSPSRKVPKVSTESANTNVEGSARKRSESGIRIKQEIEIAYDGYDSDDTCITQPILLPPRPPKDHSKDTNNRASIRQEAVNKTGSCSPSSSKVTSRDLKIERIDEGDKDWKKAAKLNQRGSHENNSNRESTEPGSKGCGTPVRHSSGDRHTGSSNPSPKTDPATHNKKAERDNKELNKRKLTDDENSRSKKIKLDSSSSHSTMRKGDCSTKQDQTKKGNSNSVRSRTDTSGTELKRKNSETSTSVPTSVKEFNFKIPMLSQKPNPAKKKPVHKGSTDRGAVQALFPQKSQNLRCSAPAHQSTPTPKAHAFNKSNVSHQAVQPTVTSKPSPNSGQSNPVAFRIPRLSDAHPSKSPVRTPVEKPIVERHQVNVNALTEPEEQVEVRKAPIRRKRRSKVPDGEALAPISRTQQLKKELDMKIEKAKREKEEKLRKEELNKQIEEREKQFRLMEMKNKFDLQRMKYNQK